MALAGHEDPMSEKGCKNLDNRLRIIIVYLLFCSVDDDRQNDGDNEDDEDDADYDDDTDDVADYDVDTDDVANDDHNDHEVNIKDDIITLATDTSADIKA